MDAAKEHAAVVGTVVASYLVHNMWMSVQVVKARKQYGIKYPALYADASNCPDEGKAKAFNCVQRAHQNSLENLPSMYALLAAAGAQHPLTASAFGAAYLVGRVCYFKGYATGDPEKRVNYGTALGYVGIFGLLGTCIKIGVSAFMDK